MTTLLVLATLVLLAIAVVLAMHVRQLVRAERDRSEANAAALAEMLGPAHLDALADGDVPDNPAASPSAMFSGMQPAAASPRTFLIPVIGLLVVMAALSGIYLWNRQSGQSVSAAEAANAPLELVALRHQRRGEMMVISGLVRNPHGGRTIQSLSAVAFTFDKQGAFLTSGRALLDFPLLQPGDESPFTVTVPNSAAIGRYRVTFRTDSGIVPHVDRRRDSQVARTGALRAPDDRGSGALRPPSVEVSQS
jgi:flagellar basal body-associated protein FliL